MRSRSQGAVEAVLAWSSLGKNGLASGWILSGMKVWEFNGSF